MIEVYKIIHVHEMYDRSVAPELPRNISSTRGNRPKYKLQNHSFRYNFRNFFSLHE